MSDTVTPRDLDGLAKVSTAPQQAAQSASGDVVELVSPSHTRGRLVVVAVGAIAAFVALEALRRVLLGVHHKTRQAMLWWHYG